MKNLCLVFSLCPIFLWGQVKIDFESELSDRWEQSPSGRWGVSAEGALEGSKSLAHVFDNPESGCDLISYFLGEIDTDAAIRWKFVLHHNYNPSGSNNWGVYLLSTNRASAIPEDMDQCALILGVNQTGTDDSLKLWFQEGSKLSLLINLGINWEKDVGMSPFSFQVEKDSLNVFSFFGAMPGEEPELIYKSQYSLPFPENPEFFALSYEYTSSKDRLLYFDNFEFDANYVSDSIAPELTDIHFLSSHCIEWIFSENVFPADTFHLNIEGGIQVDSILFQGNKIVSWFDKNFLNDIEFFYALSGFQDKKSNAGFITGSFSFYFPEYKDLIFTEIMADPSPVVYLPDSEYLEIYNRSDHTIDLNGFILKVGDKEYFLDEKIIPPHSFLAFVNMDQESDVENSVFYPLFTGVYVLSNGGQELSIWTPDGTLIDALYYSDTWYDDELKAEGGWSLERIDLYNLCGGEEIWKASTDKRGGSPGEINSLEIPVTDFENPYVDHVEFLDSLSFSLHFNESVFFNFPEIPNLKSLAWSNLLHNELILCLETPVNNIFTMEPGIFVQDCENNQNDAFILKLGVPENIEPLDVLITEVLFSPLPGCPEFIEIYNNSQSILDLHELTIDVYDPEFGPGYGSFLSETNRLFYPHEYLTITKDREAMLTCYEAEKPQILGLQTMKSLPDNGSRIAIRNRAFTLIDEMEYNEDLHFAMLSNLSGVSLERIDLENNFGLLASWHSASQNSNFSTPGAQNSQYSEKPSSENKFEITTETFTPNNDGIEDIAQLNYNLEREGYVGNVLIFDASGREVRKLAMNTLLGISGSFYWDGEDDSGNLCSTGIYLAYFSCLHLSGRNESFKEPIVLIRQF
ncbi:MAG: lamin tail domain-containing protein [Bacteroidales bacterium]|nr:lamin tail domain-containing protein [Bacteroidales bacterium]MCF8389058.1 lamin tail domain-containing protein [Bacteroidales bacterium]